MRLDDLVKDGKIYLSLSDAIALALENNYDIAIARYNLDIADTDILRTRSGSSFRGCQCRRRVKYTWRSHFHAGQRRRSRRPPRAAPAGAASGTSGIVLSPMAQALLRKCLIPPLPARSSWNAPRRRRPNTLFSGGLSALTTTRISTTLLTIRDSSPARRLQVWLHNSRITTNNPFSTYSPTLQSSFKATATQHLLQGFGIYINKRFMYEAINNRRITDSTFRQQILYTVNQVENIYWGLVGRIRGRGSQAARASNRARSLRATRARQLEIGTMAHWM